MIFPFPHIPRSVILATLALGTGLLAAGALALHMRERERQIEDRTRLDMVERVVAARDLAAGTRLTPDDLAVRGFPARWVGGDTLPLTRLGELEGRVLGTAVRAGDAKLSVCVKPCGSRYSKASHCLCGGAGLVLAWCRLGAGVVLAWCWHCREAYRNTYIYIERERTENERWGQ